MEIVRIPEAKEFSAEEQKVMEGMEDWYKIDFVPKMSRAMRVHKDFGKGYGRATRHAMADGALSRKQKEGEARRAPLIPLVDGADFHLREMRRLGASERAVIEALEVTQLFNGFTKIADTLRLTPDFTPRP